MITVRGEMRIHRGEIKVVVHKVNTSNQARCRAAVQPDNRGKPGDDNVIVQRINKGIKQQQVFFFCSSLPHL